MTAKNGDTLKNLAVEGTVTFDGSGDTIEGDIPRFNVINGTMNNCQENGLILKLYSLAAYGANGATGTNGVNVASSRNILTTVAKAVAYSKLSWNVDEKIYDTNVFATFTGYIRPKYAETALLYLTVAGTAHLWIDGIEVVNVIGGQLDARTTRTVSFDFKTLAYVPFVLHYLSTSSVDSALLLEWSFISSPVRQFVESGYFAYSGDESGSRLLGPIDAYGPGTFHSDVHFARNTTMAGNLTTDGSINCDAFASQDGDADLRFVKYDGNSTSHVEISGDGLRLQSVVGQSQNPAIRIVSADGSSSTHGLRCIGTENHMTLATSVEIDAALTTSNVSTPPITFMVGSVAVSTLREESMNVTVPLLTHNGVNITNGDLIVSGNIITSGQIQQTGKVAIGAARGALVRSEKLSIVGDNASSETGPQFATYTTLDEQPLFQLSSFSHDNISMNFDASYDGATLTPSASHAAQISKTARQFAINYYNSATATMTTNGYWQPAWSIDLEDGTGLFSGKTTVFSHDDLNGAGSVRLAPITTGAGTSIAFYSTSNMRASVAEDLFRIGYLQGKFSLRNGNDEDLINVSSTGDLAIAGAISSDGAATFRNTVSVNGPLAVTDLCTVNKLSVTGTDSADGTHSIDEALSVNGSGTIAKNMSVGGRLLAGRVHISSAVPRLVFDAPVHAASVLDTPKLGETSRGSRVILNKTKLPMAADIAIGTGPGNTLWQSVSNSSAAHEWYAGEQRIMSLSGRGDLLVCGEDGRDATVMFENIGSVSINGHGSDTGKSYGTLNLGKHWSIRGTGDTFVLTETGTGASSDSNLELPVLKVTRDNVTGSMSMTMPVIDTLQIDHGVLVAKEAAIVGQVSASRLYLANLPGTEAGVPTELSLADTFRLVSDARSSAMSSSNALTIESSVGVTINRQDIPSPFEVYYGTGELLRIDESGCSIGDTLVVKLGDIIISHGAVNVNNADTVSTFKGSLSVQKQLLVAGNGGIQFTSDDDNDMTGRATTMGYVDPNAAEGNLSGGKAKAPFLLRTSSDLVMRSNTGIKLDAGKGDVRVIGSIRVKNTALTDLGMLLTGTRTDAIPPSYSLETILPAAGHWFYVGQLNTTPNGTGPDEMGRLQVKIVDNTSEITTWAVLESGNLQISYHTIDTTAEESNPSSRVIFFRGNDGIHVFVRTGRGTGGTALSIKASIMARPPQCTDEGDGNMPNGQGSLFNESYTRMENSNNSLASRVVCGQGVFTQGVSTSGSMTVEQESCLQGGLRTTRITPITEDASLHLCGVAIDNENVQFYTTLKAGTDVVDVGTAHDPFQNAVFTATVSAGRFEAPELFISKAAEITGSLYLGDALSVMQAPSRFLQLEVTGGLAVLGKLTGHEISSDTVFCNTLQINDGLDAQGPFKLVGNSAIINAVNDTNTLHVAANDIYLHSSSSGSALRIAADGTIRASGGLYLSCGSGETIRLGRPVHVEGGDILIDGHIEGKESCILHDTLTVTGESLFQSTVQILPTAGECSLRLGSSDRGTGEIQVAGDSLIHWETGEDLVLQVPGCSNTAALKLNGNGDLVCLGDISSPYGKGTFQAVSAERCTVSEAEIETLMLGPMHNRYVLSIAENGDFACTTPLGTALTISRESACATFAGDLVSTGSASVPSIQVGPIVRISNDGRLTFLDGSHSAEVSLLAQSGETPSAFTFKNTGGDLVFQAAKDRGFTVAAVSGNATFQGQLTVESGLDVDTSATSDVATAALLIKGGVLVKRSVLIEGSLQLTNESNARFSIVAPQVGRATEGYTLRLPNSLPTSPDQCLVSNRNGQLSWRPWPSTNDTSPLLSDVATRSSPTSSHVFRQSDHVFSADNDVLDEVVDGFQVAGQSFHISHFVVTVTRDGLRNMAVAYDLRGVRVADDWSANITKTVGDDVPITFTLLSDGRLTYSASNIEAWKSTRITWPRMLIADGSHAGLTTSRMLLGYDSVIATIEESAGNMFSLGSSVCTRTMEAGKAQSWSSAYFAQSRLLDDAPSQIQAGASAATVTIEDAPDWNAAGERYSLYVAKGVSRFGGLIDAREGVKATTLTVEDAIDAKGSFALGGGSRLQTIEKGILHIGPSSRKSVTVDINFVTPMSDTAYCMMGNAVSADPDSPDAFSCTFKNLTRAGCKVTVCNIISDSWSDVTLRVHWFAVL